MATELAHDPERHRRHLRTLYEAAVREKQPSTEGRTFEQWELAVSDYGLDNARKALDSWQYELATTLGFAFCAMQRSMDAGERQRGWLECLRLASELEKLNEPSRLP